VADAQRQQRARPDATRYEDFIDRRNVHDRTAEDVEKLREAATRLDNLDKKLKQGDLSPEELAQADKEKQDIVAALPAEAREKYERLRDVRQDANNLSYRAADPAFAAAPDLSTDFQRAGTAAVQVQADARKAGPQTSLSPPAYKSAPDF
jgi:hypothetical protein